MPVVSTGVNGTAITTDSTTVVVIAGNIDVPAGKMGIGEFLLAGIDQNNRACMIGLRFGAKKVGGVNIIVGSINTGTLIADPGLDFPPVQATASIDAITGLVNVNVIGVIGATINWIVFGTFYMLSP